jgi:dTDP-4-dehydrorhamnose 3,5-epimerase-like enzyme
MPEPQKKLMTVLRGCVLDDDAYNPADELVLRRDDPQLGIDWL